MRRGRTEGAWYNTAQICQYDSPYKSNIHQDSFTRAYSKIAAASYPLLPYLYKEQKILPSTKHSHILKLPQRQLHHIWHHLHIVKIKSNDAQELLQS
jgi:hypothetical protein